MKMYFGLATGPLPGSAYEKRNFSFYCFYVKRRAFPCIFMAPNEQVCFCMCVTESVAVIPVLSVGIPPTVEPLAHRPLGDAHVDEFAISNDNVKLWQPRIS
jgi:hypothetical protein